MNDFMPDNLAEWVVSLGTILAWIISLWKVWDKLHTQVNNVGTRVNFLELAKERHETEISNLILNMQRSIDDRGVIRENVASNTKAIEAMDDQMREDRLAVMQTLHDNERAASERNAVLRESMARLEERLNVEMMIKSVVRNLREHE